MSVDGFDTAAIAYVAPSLTRLWNLGHAAMTPAFVATSAGAVVGYVASGIIVRTMPRRKMILLAMLLFGGFSFLTIISPGIAVISVIRFFTTVCLGVVVPGAISVAADSAPDDARASATIAATTGLSVGAALGGLLSPRLIAGFGWEAVFVVGGLVPILLLPLVWHTLPSGDEPTVSQGVAHHAAHESSWLRQAKTLFSPQHLSDTVTVWMVAFFSFFVSYLFVFWTPMLLLSMGFSTENAPVGVAASALGGIAGNLLLFALATRLGIQRSLLITISVAIACIAVFQIGGLDRWAVLLLIFGVGVGTTSLCAGQSALATVLFPAALRTTSVGNAAAIGRVGAIMGPSAGGILISFGVSSQHVVLLSCIPLCVVAFVLSISRKLARKSTTPEPKRP
ncbi:aromatic acid/H+ symport family MFS transporter [Paraburkholderia aspalathi]|nr:MULTISPECIES: MFS transporter [Paraburkholderia]MBK3812854.1 aromatic acid/H+ symport family MFS transporter [Paraburkholderia aspalathi]